MPPKAKPKRKSQMLIFLDAGTADNHGMCHNTQDPQHKCTITRQWEGELYVRDTALHHMCMWTLQRNIYRKVAYRRRYPVVLQFSLHVNLFITLLTLRFSLGGDNGR